MTEQLPTEGNSDTPLLSTWKTSVGATIGGIVVSAIASRFSLPWELSLLIGAAFFVGGLYYALAVYPSFFTERPKMSSAGAISFCNGLFGYIIFGCIWNSNLTNKVKGISNVVYAVLSVVFVILAVYVGFYL